MTFELDVHVDQETDGRWIAEVPSMPGVMCYGDSVMDAIKKVSELAIRVRTEPKI
jgi:predicted RNase H-like HicB family nuclease